MTHDDYYEESFFIADTQARFCKTFQNTWKYFVFDTKMQDSHVPTSCFTQAAAAPWGGGAKTKKNDKK